VRATGIEQQCSISTDPGNCHFIRKRVFTLSAEGGRIKATPKSDVTLDTGCQDDAAHD
jgi:hypothetical protein